MKKRNLLKRKFSFTILEMLMATGLLSLIVYSLLSMLNQTQKTTSLGISKMNIFEDARTVIGIIETDIGAADFFTDKGNKYDNDDVIKIKNDGETLEVLTKRMGTLDQLCRVVYSYNKSKYTLTMEVYRWIEDDLAFERNPSHKAILLKNVAKFKIDQEVLQQLSTSGDGSYQKALHGLPHTLILQMALLDEDTLRLGYKSLKDAEENNIDETRIKKALGNSNDALIQRYQYFTRVIPVDLTLVKPR